MTLPRPLFKRQRIAIMVGLGLFLIGSWVLYDAFERRGANTPRVLRPFTWW